MSEETEAKAKLAKVAEQVNRMDVIGDQFDMECPYCQSLTAPGKPFCCTKMYNAVGVVIEARDKFKRAAFISTMVN